MDSSPPSPSVPLARRQFLGGAAAAVAGSLGNVAMGRNTSEPESGSRIRISSDHVTAPSNAAVTGVDPGEWVLFAFDDHWLPFRSQLDLAMHQPELHESNPVLRRGPAGAHDSFFAAMYGTVFREGGKFRVWYCGVDSWEGFEPGRTNLRLAYAESDDGVVWKKPRLGLREYKGDRDNNLLGLERDCYNPVVLFEPDDPDPARRFKMVYTGYHHQGIGRSPLLCVAYSADGLRWTDHPANPVVKSIWTEISGCYRWNGIYYANGQSGYPASNPKRTMVSFASPDLIHWEEAGIISFHRPETQEGFHVGRQVHLGASIWHRRNVLLGLYGAWQGPPTNRKPDVRMNLGLIVSNDGMLFREPVPDFAVVRWGSERSGWKTFRLLQGSAFVNHGEKTYLWYGAGMGEHEAIENACEVGLATYPRDRFGSLTPRKSGALVTSHALAPMPDGAQVFVNADGLGPDARIEVDLLDGNFVPAGQFAGPGAAILQRSGLREELKWKAASIKNVTRESWRIRVRFEGADAGKIRFYCLYVLPANGTKPSA